MSGTAEILCIGTELLLGNITNGNARWLAERLAAEALPYDNAAEDEAWAWRCRWGWACRWGSLRGWRPWTAWQWDWR